MAFHPQRQVQLPLAYVSHKSSIKISQMTFSFMYSCEIEFWTLEKTDAIWDSWTVDGIFGPIEFFVVQN